MRIYFSKGKMFSHRRPFNRLKLFFSPVKNLFRILLQVLTVQNFSQMYLVHEEMLTYETNGQTFADFCFKWANQPFVFQPLPNHKTNAAQRSSIGDMYFQSNWISRTSNIWKVIGLFFVRTFLQEAQLERSLMSEQKNKWCMIRELPGSFK